MLFIILVILIVVLLSLRFFSFKDFYLVYFCVPNLTSTTFHDFCPQFFHKSSDNVCNLYFQYLSGYHNSVSPDVTADLPAGQAVTGSFLRRDGFEKLTWLTVDPG